MAAISEQYWEAAVQWADVESAAHINEELKSTVLEQRKHALIKENPSLADSAAERTVKASPQWEEYIRETCRYRGAANLLKQKLKYLDMKHREWIGMNADERQERRQYDREP